MNQNLKDIKISDNLGSFLVKLARKTVYEHFRYKPQFILPECEDKQLHEKMGAFVTIQTYPERELRGCIGYPLPYKELIIAVKENALNAAFEDPRFEPLNKSELEKIIFEVTVLTKPEEIKYANSKELVECIEIGKHGLIVQHGFFSGLLLPQVPVEYNWNIEEFLSHTCEKAGLPYNYWKNNKLSWKRFEGIVFEEETPEGNVKKKILNIRYLKNESE
ncbi:MAG: TIGR00296 family protein [Candidatus Aenigmatarchaeota archaeon]